jgi:hypothetical protein
VVELFSKQRVSSSSFTVSIVRSVVAATSTVVGKGKEDEYRVESVEVPVVGGTQEWRD